MLRMTWFANKGSRFTPFYFYKTFCLQLYLQLNLTLLLIFITEKSQAFQTIPKKLKKKFHKLKYLKVTDTMGKREVADCSIEL